MNKEIAVEFLTRLWNKLLERQKWDEEWNTALEK